MVNALSRNTPSLSTKAQIRVVPRHLETVKKNHQAFRVSLFFFCIPIDGKILSTLESNTRLTLAILQCKFRCRKGTMVLGSRSVTLRPWTSSPLWKYTSRAGVRDTVSAYRRPASFFFLQFSQFPFSILSRLDAKTKLDPARWGSIIHSSGVVGKSPRKK